MTIDAFTLLLVLLPGVIASLLLDTLVERKPKEGLSFVVETVVFSVVIYVCIGLLFNQPPYTVEAAGGTGKFPHVIISHPASFVTMILLSLVFPLGFGALYTRDCILSVFRWLGVTRRTGRATVWLDIFINHRNYVIVTFTDGRRIFGWPEYYSDDVAEGMLYLYDPSWIDDEGNYTSLGVQGFLLPSREKIESIIFTNVTSENAHLHADNTLTANETSSLSVNVPPPHTNGQNPPPVPHVKPPQAPPVAPPPKKP